MPAPKKMTAVADQHTTTSELDIAHDNPQLPMEDDARDLLKWVGRVIVTRNANGKQSDKFCKLCSSSKLHKEACRHAEVWELARK